MPCKCCPHRLVELVKLGVAEHREVLRLPTPFVAIGKHTEALDATVGRAFPHKCATGRRFGARQLGAELLKGLCLRTVKRTYVGPVERQLSTSVPVNKVLGNI